MSVGGTHEAYAATNAAFGYLRSGGTINLMCGEGGASGGYIDPGAVLWARRVGAVTAVENGCGAYLVNATTDLVALTRRSACPLAYSGLAMSSALISKGTWVAFGGESEIFPSSPTAAPSGFVRCELRAGPDGSPIAHLDITPVWQRLGYVVGLTVLATMKATTPTVVEERCLGDNQGSSGSDLTGGLILIRP